MGYQYDELLLSPEKIDVHGIQKRRFYKSLSCLLPRLHRLQHFWFCVRLCRTNIDAVRCECSPRHR